MSGAGGGGRANLVLAVLSMSMFIYVVDTTIMNVSISALVEDLDTSVGRIQAAITVYSLTMAAFMVTGGKLGDIWGSKRAFRIGLVVYGTGTTITALAPNVATLLIGWSILEGLGSALIVPAVNTLVRANYVGPARAKAYGVLWGVAAAGAAFGPIVGGWLTTYYTWRLAFAAEAVIVVIVLLATPLVTDAPRPAKIPKLDVPGVVLSVVGLGSFVLGILQASSWGWQDTRVWVLIAVGLIVLVVFFIRATRREAAGLPTLLYPSLMRHRSMSGGVPVLISQTFVQAGLLFMIPVFCQLVLGLDAFDTGLTLLPLSIVTLVVAMGTPSLGHRIYPRTLIQVGLGALAVGGILLAIAIPGAESGGDLALALAVVGLGIGLVVAQLPNLMLSGVDPDEASEAAGVQGTSQNLGFALGTAIVGSVLVVLLTSSLASGVRDSTVLNPSQKDNLTELLQQDVREVTDDQFAEAVGTVAPEQEQELVDIRDDAVVRAFQLGLIPSAIVALAGVLFAFRLPKRKLDGGVVEESVRASRAVPRLELEATDLSPSGGAPRPTGA